MGAGDTPRGVMIGGPPSRSAMPGSSYNFDFSGISPLLNALMGRWGQAMDYQLQDLSQQPGRNEVAFREWLQKRKTEQDARDLELSQMRKAAGRQTWSARPAAPVADEGRTALNASVGRARAQQSQHGAPVGFNPSGAVADFYEYGAGNPQGRGGGGSVASGRVSDTAPSDDLAVKNCLQNQLGPGCEGVLASAGYVRNQTTGYWEQPPRQQR